MPPEFKPRLRLNEAIANELARILDEEVERMMISRREMIDGGDKGSGKYVNLTASIRRVQDLRKQLTDTLRDYGWGDFAND